MHLAADTIYAEPKDDDYPISVGFRDNSAEYCLIFSRFSDMSPDEGTIEVMVSDQIHTQTASLAVELKRSQCHVVLDEKTTSELLGVREYTVDFQADNETYRLMVELLQLIFEGLPGLNVLE